MPIDAVRLLDMLIICGGAFISKLYDVTGHSSIHAFAVQVGQDELNGFYVFLF